MICGCSNGMGRTGTFCVVYVAIDAINQGNGIMPLPELVSRLRLQRRSLVQYKEQLQFCYDAVLCYAQDVLLRREYAVCVSIRTSRSIAVVRQRHCYSMLRLSVSHSLVLTL